MPEPFHLTAWLRRHPLTTLLLLATVCVNVVMFFSDSTYSPIAETARIALLVSQLSLLAWWTTAATKRMWLRFVTLFLATGAAANQFSIHHEFINRVAFAYFLLHSIVVAFFSWVAWRLFDERSDRPIHKSQFSVRQLLGMTTLVAVVAALSRYADFDEIASDAEDVIVLSSATALGIIAPGLGLLRPWPLQIRFALPLVLGLVMCIAEAVVNSDNDNKYWVLIVVSAAVYSIYNLCIALDSHRPSVSTPDPPPAA